MMLSPADYAAYSRQTGRAYPQSEEEKAEMYGEVREFRENQLKAPSTLQTAGGIALGAGALAGIGAAAMKLRGRARDPRMQSGASAGKSGVQRVDLSNEAEVRRIANLNTAKQDLGGSRPRRIAENEVISDYTQLQKSLGEANAIESKYQQRQMPGAFPAPEKAENTGLGEFQRFSQQADAISAEAKRRQSVYQDVAVKPESELPPVSIPKGGVEESGVVTNPITGEIQRRGGGPSMRAEELRDETVAKLTKLASETPAQAEVSTAETLTETYEAVGEPAARVQSIDAVDSASDQIDSKFEATVQRDIDSVKYGKSAVAQEIAQEPVRMIRRQGKLVPLNQLQEQAAKIASPQVGLRQQEPNRFLRKAPSFSAEEINTFADEFDVYGRPIPKAEQTLGLIGPQPRNVYSAETPGPAPANEAQIARRELVRQAETLLKDIQIEEQAKGILFDLAAQYDPQQALAAKRAELQAKGLKGQRLEKILASTTGSDVRAALEDARLQPGLQTEGAPLKFSREVPNVGPEAVVTKTATGSAIRGAGRLSDEPPAQTRERTLFGDYPDPLVTGQPVDPVPDRPGKETVLGQMVSAPTPRIDKYEESQEGAGAGVGVYGRETNYVPGAMSKQTGEYSAAASRKPTDVTGFKTLGDQPSPYQALSDEDLGMMSMVGSKEDAYNANKVLASRRSFDVARDIQRLQRSGRPDAQKLVKDYLNKLQA